MDVISIRIPNELKKSMKEIDFIFTSEEVFESTHSLFVAHKRYEIFTDGLILSLFQHSFDSYFHIRSKYFFIPATKLGFSVTAASLR